MRNLAWAIVVCILGNKLGLFHEVVKIWLKCSRLCSDISFCLVAVSSLFLLLFFLFWVCHTKKNLARCDHPMSMCSPPARNGTAASVNIPSGDMCVQRRLRSACASAQSDQSLCCPHEETLHPWLIKMRPVKILIRLRECAGWSESLLGAIPKLLILTLLLNSSLSCFNWIRSEIT